VSNLTSKATTQSLIALDAFICAIVISIARLCPFEGDLFAESALNNSWLRGMAILDHFKPQMGSVERAMEILHCLNTRVAKIIKRGQFGH
jgi:hypothetical protein